MEWLMQLPAWVQALIATAFTYAMTAFGAAFVFLSGKIRPAVLTLMQGSAAGIMIAASFFSLLLPAAERLESAGALSALVLGAGFLAGSFFIVFAEIVLRRVRAAKESLEQSGAKQGEKEQSGAKQSGKKQSGALTFFAMTLHNIPEGLSVGVAFGALAFGDGAGWAGAALLALGIGIQNFPEGLCVAVPMRRQGYSAARAFFYGQFSGCVEVPAGVLGAVAVGAVTALLPWALSFSAGAMIAVSCAELIPASLEEGKTLTACGIAAGFALMMVLDVCATFFA